MNFDFSTLPDSLKDYSRKHNGVIYQEMFGAGMAFKRYMTQMYGDDEIVLTNFKMKKVVQSGEYDPNATDCGFTPTPLGAVYGARTLKLRKGKVNLKLHGQEIEQLYRNFIGSIRTSGPRKTETDLPQPFAQNLFSNINAQASDEIGESMAKGTYVSLAPSNVGIVDGLLTTLANGIGNDIPTTQVLPLVPIDETNAFVEIRKNITKIRETKPQYLTRKMILVCGPKVKDCYEQNLASMNNGINFDFVNANGQPYVKGYPNIVFEVDENLGESDAIIVATRGNLVWATDNDARFTNLDIEKFEYCLKFMLDFKVGFDYILGGEIWCNDLTSL
jgi:hypothetical protein